MCCGCVLLVLLVLSVLICRASARTDMYNDLVSDVLSGGKTYYELLGVERDASVDAVKKAYRKLAATAHPDKSTEPDAAEQFQSVLRAYSVLKDDDARREYDFLLAHGVPYVERFGYNAQIVTRDIGLAPALLLALLLFSGIHWALKWGEFNRTWNAMRATADYDRLRAQHLKKRDLKLAYCAADAPTTARASALRTETLAAINEFETKMRDQVRAKCAPTWRDFLPVQLCYLALARHRRSKRTAAEIELDNAQRRGLTLGEYRRRLGEHVMALAQTGQLQPYIAQCTGVPQLLTDDDDDDGGGGGGEQANDDDENKSE